MTININLKIFLFAIIFYFTRQIEIYAILMIFAFLHEMGHFICGLILGLKPKSLKIMPFGLCMEFNVLCSDYNKKIKYASKFAIKKMIIALAGPITNVLIVIGCALFKNKIDVILYNNIVYANLLIAIFNLLPIYPLDGGRVIKEILYVIRGNKKSSEDINIISNISVIIITMISSIAIYYYQNIGILFIIIYLWGLTIIENKKYQMKKRIYKIIENS